MTRILITAVAALALAVPAATAAPTREAANPSIATLATKTPQLSTLLSLVKKAGLAGTLSQPGAYTVFAPTNAAFAKVPKATLDSLANNPAALKRVLLYHVVAGKVPAAKVVTLRSAKTLAGPTVQHPRHRQDCPDQLGPGDKGGRDGVERDRARDRPRADPAGCLVGCAARELGLDQFRAEPARREQRVAVEPDVGELLDEPLVRLTGAGERGLQPFLAHFPCRERRVVQQRDDVRPLRPLPFALLDPPPEPGREARLRPRVAGGTAPDGRAAGSRRRRSRRAAPRP